MRYKIGTDKCLSNGKYYSSELPNTIDIQKKTNVGMRLIRLQTKKTNMQCMKRFIVVVCACVKIFAPHEIRRQRSHL